MRTGIFIALFLIALTAANLIVKYFGAHGLWISSFILIPFDFVCRCIFHETWKGWKLVVNLFVLTIWAALITIIFNYHAIYIAVASIAGFISAQIGAGIFYQWRLKKKESSWFIKINVSDAIAICFDSVVFQYIAFSFFNWTVMIGQIGIKILGGLLWYAILFKMLNIQKEVSQNE